MNDSHPRPAFDPDYDLHYGPVHEDFAEPHRGSGFLSFWRKIGGGSLTFAVLLHLTLLVIAGFVVFRTFVEPEKVVDFLPGGGGGGSGGEQGPKLAPQKRHAATVLPNDTTRRLAAEGLESAMVLPDPGESFGDKSVLSSMSGGLGGGLEGSGSGGGLGKGKGNGIGSGVGDGFGGHGVGPSPFGAINPSAHSMVGVFYDTKQTSDGKPTDLSETQFCDLLANFVKQGWKEQMLAKYYRAPRRLYQNLIYMPKMPAEAAPEAFGCADVVKPSRWIVIYRCNVVPPQSGRFRFVGAGDDVLLVRFNGRLVFDHGFFSGVFGRRICTKEDIAALRGEAGADKDRMREFRSRGVMKPPVTFYQYPTTQDWNRNIGGVAVGPEIDMRAGSSYPIEILITEIPGGLFCASLQIEEVGAETQKASTGAPILPLFRLSNMLPEIKKDADNAPPFDPAGPVWKADNRGFSDESAVFD